MTQSPLDHGDAGFGRPALDVSVIIAAYNAERFLQECLESALTQQGVAFEVIVVDDGSTDGTRAVIREYEGRVRLVEQPNAGVSCARNAGAALANGEFLWFLDADDRLLPGALVALVTSARSAGVSFAYGQAFAIDACGQRVASHVIGYYGPGGNTLRRICHGTLFPPSAGLFSREQFERLGGFDPTITHGEDLDLEYRFAELSEACMISTPVVEYRLHDASATGNYPATTEQVLQVHTRYARRNRTWARYPVATLAGRGKIAFYFAMQHRAALRSGHGKWLSEAKKTLSRHPWLRAMVLLAPPLEALRKRVHQRVQITP